MVTGNVFIGFDFYHAGVYAPEPDSNRDDWPGYEAYGHDLEHFYVVVNAFLIRFEKDGENEGDPVQVGPDSSPDLVRYLSLWGAPADRDLSGLKFVTLDRETIRDLSSAYQGWRMSVTPVPLPPGLDLGVGLGIVQDGETKEFSVRRTLGGDSLPFALDGQQWIAFARDNFIQIPIKTENRLSAIQRKGLVNWVVSAATVAIRREEADEKLSVGEIALLDSVRDLLPLGEAFRKALNTGQPPRYWTAIEAVAAQGDKDLAPPRPVFDRGQLNNLIASWNGLDDEARRNLTGELFGKKVGGENDTYLEFVGTAFHALTQGSAGDAAENAMRAEEAISRLLGFGERLRWPKGAMSPGTIDDLMILRWNRTQPQGRFVTNAHSLLGLVFRLGPFNPHTETSAVPESNVSITVGSGGLQRLNGSPDATFKARFAKAVKNLLEDVRTNLAGGADFKATLSPAHPDGILFARPRSLQMEIAKGVVSPDGQHRLLRVPAALLDVIDSEPRTEYPPVKATTPDAAATDVFHRRAKTQRLIRPSDLFMSGQDLELAKDDRTACATFQVKVSRLMLRFADSVTPTAPVYEIRFLNTLNEDELDFAQGLVETVLGDAAKKKAELWVTTITNDRPDNTKAFALAGRGFASAPARDDENGQPVFTIVDDVDNTLTDLVGSAAGNRSGTADENGPSVQFDLVLKPDAEDRFNMIIDERGTEDLVLHPANVFTTRLSRSAERLHERFDTTLSPTPQEPEQQSGTMEDELADNDAVLDDFGNFKKLRLELWPKVDGAPKIGLTYPASLQPLPSRRELAQSRGHPIPADYRAVGPDGFSEPGPHFGYWIAHQFTEEIVGNVRDDGDAEGIDDDMNQHELGRYALYTNPGSAWSLTGHVENVYNHRVPVTRTDIHLGLSVDVRSLASARSMSFKTNPGNGEKPSDPEGRIALRYEIDGTELPETLVLTLDHEFIERALGEYETTPDQDNEPGRLRFLYEALADMKHCLAPSADTGHVALSLERWNFDNRRHVKSANDSSAMQERSMPSILGNLRCHGRAVRLLTPDQLALWTDLLAPTFDGFVARLKANHSNDLPIRLPMQDGNWQWVFGQVDAIGTTTNAIRLGLSLKRAGHVTATATQANGVPVMLRKDLLGFDDDLFGYNEDWDPNDPESKPYTPEGADARTDFLKAAGVATDTYLSNRGSSDVFPDGSALHKSFRWIATTPPKLHGRDEEEEEVRPDRDPDNVDRNKGSRLRRIFGPAAEFSHFPPAVRERVGKTSKVYLVLYAMKPVRRHKFFRDGATTELFLQYLVDLIADLLAGRKTDRVELTKEQLDAATLYKHRTTLQGLADALSEKLVETFLDRVDDVESLLDPAKERQGRLDHAEEIEDDTERQAVIDRTHQDFDAFAEIHALAEQVRSDPSAGSDIAIRSMIRKDPSVVNWAKGFAVGIFEKNSYSERLYSLRIRRRIGPPKMTNDPNGYDNDRRFHGEPITYESILQTDGGENYFIEALPDSIYQHSFRIDRAKGDMEARTAEDVIENKSPYTKEGKSPLPDSKRNLSLVVDHFNPEWQLRPLALQLEDAKERYFLPSRDAPVTPVPIEPETETDSASDISGAKPKNPWYSEMFYRDKDRRENKPLHQTFKERLTRILTTDDGDGTEPGKKRINITPTMAAESIEGTLAFAELPDGSTNTTAAGWHFIDTYLSHFMFLLTPDEEAPGGTSQRPDIGLWNDTIPLQVDRFVKLGPEPVVEADVKTFEAKTGLHGWFAYSRAKAAQGARKDGNDTASDPVKEAPDSMAIATVLSELDVWINQPASAQTGLGDGTEIKDKFVDDLFQANTPEPEPTFRAGTARLSFDREDSKWKLVVKRPPTVEGAPEPAEDGVGSVVAVDFMRQISIENDEEKPIGDRVILRVTVLDETRTRTRARARVMRNQVDVDGDLDGDLNPAFVRVTPYSEWASYPPYLLTYTEDEVLQFPNVARFLVVGPDSGASADIQSLAGWIGQARDEHDFGADLIWKNVLNAKVQTRRGETVSLFTHDTRTDTDPAKPPFLIDGSVVQMLGDHIQQAESTGQARAKVAERHDAVVTQLLRPNKENDDASEADTWVNTKGKHFYSATERGFGAIMKHMDRAKIKSADPNIVITWYNPEGVPIMEINWPVVWHDELDD